MPTPDFTPNEEEIFQTASALPVAEREEYLDRACAGYPELRSSVERLLVSLDDGAFMDRPSDRTASPPLESEFARLKPEEAGDRIGAYKLLQQIGEGGFGVVWMAEQEKPVRRRVALKIIKLGMDTKEVIARFEQERQALALMDHPNIARVFDAGATVTGRPFFVMELVKGVRITEYCDSAQLSTADRLKLFIHVCNAVQHAHQKGIIHRDLKPSNILVTLHDGIPVPKVIDFGVAKATLSQRLTDLTLFTQFEQMIGTPLYMAPEQAELSGLDVDTRSDIYSLGVLLYELLTGRTPFDPEQLMKAGYDEMRRVIREEEPQKPSTFLSTMALETKATVAKQRGAEGANLISSIRGDLDWIVMKALEKDRNRRYETASGFARDIERHLQSEPVLARPASASYRMRRFVARNRRSVIAGTAVAIAVISGITSTVWQGLRARAALADLRASAPAFAAMARGLVANEKFHDAIEKLDAAIKLRPDLPDYVLAKADLLQSQFRFSEAAQAYRKALRLRPAEARAKANAALCENLGLEMSSRGSLSRESLLHLFGAMGAEQRSAAEMMHVGQLLGEENSLLLRYWSERLKELPVSPERPLEQRLTISKEGALVLDLRETRIVDLSPLKGMPLGTLNLAGCNKILDFEVLRGMPLHSLTLHGTQVADLSPLETMKTLGVLHLRGTNVRDLSPLRGLSLTELSLDSTLVSDLSPLRGMPLNVLSLATTKVSDLRPLTGAPLKKLDFTKTPVSDVSALAGMPLEELEANLIAAQDFSALAGAPLRHLSLQGSGIGDIAPLRGMPLKTLFLNGCIDARSLHVLRELEMLEDFGPPPMFGMRPAELEALGKLRDHPRLRSIREWDPSGPPDKSGFWREYDKYTKGQKLNAAAVALALQGDFAEAERLIREEVRLKPGYSGTWVELGTVLLAKGDLTGFQGICRQMIERFRQRLGHDEVAVRLCVMSPSPGVPFAELSRLMPHFALVNPATPFRCNFARTNGMLEYRAGRYAEAIALLEQTESSRFPDVVAMASVGLGMAHFRLGHLETARAHLAHAREFIRSGSQESPGFGWFAAGLLLKEADGLIASSTPTDPPK